MPEIPDVVAGNTVASAAWGNPIRDRTIQRYADVTARDAGNPAPAEGITVYVESLDKLQVWTGAAWVTILDSTSAYSQIGHTHDATTISDLDAADTTTGVFDVARIPNMDAAKITTGVFPIARIPTGTTGTTVALGNHTHTGSTISGLDAGDVTTGVFAVARIPGLAYLPLSGGTVTGSVTFNSSVGFGSDVTLDAVFAPVAGQVFDLSARQTIGAWSIASPSTTADNGLPSWRHMNVGSPYELRPLVSSIKAKLDVRDADVDDLADAFFAVRLADFKSALPGDDARRRYQGWIAEEAYEKLPHFTAKPDNEGYVASVGSMEVPMAAALHQLHRRVKALEEAS